MTRYAVKIGEIVLQSDQPVSDEQKRRAVELLLDRPGAKTTADGLKILYTVGSSPA